MEYVITNHAKTRCNQRGVRMSAVRAALQFGDIEVPTRDGCKRLQLSNKALEAMLADGFKTSDADAAKKLALIVDEEDRVVTVMKISPNHRRTKRTRTRRFNRRIG